MFRSMTPSRRGMTLPELLIVVAIIGLLAATVLPAIGTTTEARRGREAARLVSGYCARAQSAAIGKREWQGLMIQPPNSVTSGALTLRLAAVPPPYIGAILDARLAVQSTSTGTNTALPASACPTINAVPSTGPLELADIADASINVQENDLIQFDGEGPMYEIVSRSPARITFRLRDGSGADNAGFTTANSPWPSATPATHTFEIFRQPVPSGSPFEMPNNRVIDLSWSGFGPSNDTLPHSSKGYPFTANYTVLAEPAQPVPTTTILFDATGRMRMITKGAARITPQHPVYLLVGRPDRVGNAFAPTLSNSDDSIGANWQYSDSWWIAIDPLTGSVRSAACRPNAAFVTESQEFVRRQL
jgi:prepilin-type N-terminal cleavage/methylation domain-containing protein